MDQIVRGIGLSLVLPDFDIGFLRGLGIYGSYETRNVVFYLTYAPWLAHDSEPSQIGLGLFV